MNFGRRWAKQNSEPGGPDGRMASGSHRRHLRRSSDGCSRAKMEQILPTPPNPFIFGCVAHQSSRLPRVGEILQLRSCEAMLSVRDYSLNATYTSSLSVVNVGEDQSIIMTTREGSIRSSRRTLQGFSRRLPTFWIR